MKKVDRLNAIYQFYTAYLQKPRTSGREMHRKYSSYRCRESTLSTIEYALENEILIGPYIYCNRHESVILLKDVNNPLDLLEKKKKDPSTTYAIALCGNYSFLSFVLGKIQHKLKYAEITRPSFPGRITPEELTFDSLGELEPDSFPESWNEFDWKVYHRMRDPSISYLEVGKELGVSFMTVKRHFQKIIKDCKPMIAFFPRGYRGYSKALLTFKTKYEVGVKEALEKLDRSSYLWKFDDTIVLNLFVEDYNATCERFKEMEKIGMIDDFGASIPIRYYTHLCHF